MIIEPFNYENKKNEEQELDFKAMYLIVLNYKKSILFIIFIFTFMAFIQAYFTHNTYKSTALIKLESARYNSYKDDLVTNAMGNTDNTNIDDEIATLKTRVIAQKSLENLNIGVRYYSQSLFKKHELYKDAPFVVTLKSLSQKAYNLEIELKPIDSKTFTLLIEPSFLDKVYDGIRHFFIDSHPENDTIAYKKKYHYGESIETPWFLIKIQKVHQFEDKTYSFTLNKNESMGWLVHRGLSAALHTKYGNFITLKFIDSVPTRAKEVLESVIHAYIKDNVELKTKSIQRKIHFIDMQLSAMNETLKSSANKLQSYKITNLDVDLNTSTHQSSTKLSVLESELYSLSLKTDIMENMLNYLDTHNDISSLDPYSAKQVSPAVSSILNDIHTDNVERMGLSAKFTLMHPSVIKLTNRIKFNKKRLHEIINSTLQSLNTQKETIREGIRIRKNALKTLPMQEQQLEQLTRNFKVNEKIYAFLLQKRAEIAITESSIVSDIRILENPIVSYSPISPNRKMIISIGLLLGILLALALSFLRDFIDNTIKKIEDIEKRTDIPIYGGLPLYDKNGSKNHYEEAIRVLWNNIEFSNIESESKIITFTSSISGEGKTLTTSELGNIIAQGDKSVIILDLDMRKSDQHTNYNLSNTKGMSTLLTHKYTLQEVIQKTSCENLHIITGGPTPPNPTELIMSKLLEDIIAKLKKKYDYILIDSPPIGLVADATKLMYLSDLTLIVFKAHISKKDFIKNIMRLTQDPKIHKGIILNALVQEDNYGYGYGY